MSTRLPKFKSFIFRTALAAMLAVPVLAVWSQQAKARDDVHQVVMYGGNEFLVRKTPAGRGRIYIQLYRLTGDQWEWHSVAKIDPRSKRRGTSLPEKIYYTGRPVGRVAVDLDNPLNTDLNRFPGR